MHCSYLDAELYITRARCLRDLMQYGLMPPDPAPSEEYKRGWEAACIALLQSDELRLLREVLADAEEAFDDVPSKAKGRAE